MGLCVTVGRCGKEQNHVTEWQTSLGFYFFLYMVPNQTVSSEGQRLPLFFSASLNTTKVTQEVTLCRVTGWLNKPDFITETGKRDLSSSSCGALLLSTLVNLLPAQLLTG